MCVNDIHSRDCGDYEHLLRSAARPPCRKAGVGRAHDASARRLKTSALALEHGSEGEDGMVDKVSRAFRMKLLVSTAVAVFSDRLVCAVVGGGMRGSGQPPSSRHDDQERGIDSGRRTHHLRQGDAKRHAGVLPRGRLHQRPLPTPNIGLEMWLPKEDWNGVFHGDRQRRLRGRPRVQLRRDGGRASSEATLRP